MPADHSSAERKRVLILGAGLMQRPAFETARKRGWHNAAADGNPGALCAPLADRFEAVDLKDTDALLRFACGLHSGGGLDAVFTAGTDFSLPVALIAERLSLPGHAPAAAKNATDKILMRRCFLQCGVPSPRFAECAASELASVDGSYADRAGLSFPLVVKPADNMGARGCMLVHAAAQLRDAVQTAVQCSRTGRAIIEEYMEGPEFSVDALVFDGKVVICGFADRHIRFPPYFIEMGHTMPTDIGSAALSALTEAFVRGVAAVGLSCGAAKGDIKLTPDGPMIGEIAARLSGGYMSGWTFPYASGVNVTDQALLLASGSCPDALSCAEFRQTVRAPLRIPGYVPGGADSGTCPGDDIPVYAVPAPSVSAERAWISVPGVVRSVDGYAQAAAVPYVRDVFSRAKEGDHVVFPSNNVEKCGNIISCAPSRSEAIVAALRAVQSVVLRLETGNAETDEFLFSSAPFPPPAFSLAPEDTSAVAALPDFEDFSGENVFPSVLIPSVPPFLKPYFDMCSDWHGRSFRSAFGAYVRIVSDECAGMSGPGADIPHAGRLYGVFWRAFVRGSLQGALYTADMYREGRVCRSAGAGR